MIKNAILKDLFNLNSEAISLRFPGVFGDNAASVWNKRNVHKLMNKYLVSWTLLFPEKKVFLISARPGQLGPVSLCVAAPGPPGPPGGVRAGPVAAPKQALVWIYSSSVRPLTNQYKLTLVTSAHLVNTML